jgi:hypothetical protein
MIDLTVGSTEEGLDQEFNSLDAQREFSLAFQGSCSDARLHSA